MSGSLNENGNGPEPPRTIAIIIACVVGAAAVAGLLLLVNLLR